MSTPLGRRRAFRLRMAILAWYRTHGRDLPWRRGQGAYGIWVSEVMLQQTRVDTVIPYYADFLRRWPDVAALAAADPDAVRAVWSGLGYYRRAKLMHDAARQIVAEHGGELPRTAERLRQLPGFGRYTAGAVASMAFGEATPAVDGNVERVLTRLLAVEEDPRSAAASRAIWDAAREIVDGEAPGDVNQGLIELGALVCTPKAPRCAECPLGRSCAAHRRNVVDLLPRARSRRPRTRLEMTVVVALVGARSVVLERRPEHGLFAGLYSPPMLDGHLPEDGVGDELLRRYGWAPRTVRWVAEVKHLLTHRDLSMHVVSTDGAGVPESLVIADVGRLDGYGLSSAAVRALRAALPPDLLEFAALPGRRRRRGPPFDAALDRVVPKSKIEF